GRVGRGAAPVPPTAAAVPRPAPLAARATPAPRPGGASGSGDHPIRIDPTGRRRRSPPASIRRLRDDAVAQLLVLLVGESALALHAVELLELVGGAVADDLPKLFPLLHRLSLAPLGPAVVLGDEVDEDAQPRDEDDDDDPQSLDPSVDVAASEDVDEDRDDEPEEDHPRKDVEDA